MQLDGIERNWAEVIGIEEDWIALDANECN